MSSFSRPYTLLSIFLFSWCLISLRVQAGPESPDLHLPYSNDYVVISDTQKILFFKDPSLSTIVGAFDSKRSLTLNGDQLCTQDSKHKAIPCRVGDALVIDAHSGEVYIRHLEASDGIIHTRVHQQDLYFDLSKIREVKYRFLPSKEKRDRKAAKFKNVIAEFKETVRTCLNSSNPSACLPSFFDAKFSINSVPLNLAEKASSEKFQKQVRSCINLPPVYEQSDPERKMWLKKDWMSSCMLVKRDRGWLFLSFFFSPD